MGRQQASMSCALASKRLAQVRLFILPRLQCHDRPQRTRLPYVVGDSGCLDHGGDNSLQYLCLARASHRLAPTDRSLCRAQNPHRPIVLPMEWYHCIDQDTPDELIWPTYIERW